MTCPTCHYCKTISTDITSPGGYKWVAVEIMYCTLHDEWVGDENTCEEHNPKGEAHDTP